MAAPCLGRSSRSQVRVELNRLYQETMEEMDLERDECTEQEVRRLAWDLSCSRKL